MRSLALILLSFSPLFHCSAQQSIEAQKQFYTYRAEHYLDKDRALGSYYTINDSGIFISALSPEKVFYREFGIAWKDVDALRQIIHCLPDDSLLTFLSKREWLELPACSNKSDETSAESEKKLSGIKIAIDPGHIAGDMKTAILEKKYVSFNYNGRDIKIAEGMLTLQTALILKHLLEEQGAEVMLTRDRPNQTAFGITFSEWREQHFKNAVDSLYHIKELTEEEKTFLLTKAGARDIFRNCFNNLDMKQRAKKINSYAPDLTVIIHYNVDEKNIGWHKPGTRNYNMLFTGGSFLKNELEKPEDRIAFFRLLLADDLGLSQVLAESLINSFSEKLGVPSATEQDADYLKKYCLVSRTQGVFARNLTLTRLVKGAVVYGETLYQDNEKECLLLTAADTEVYGVKTSARVKQVAEAYYEGIRKYLDKK